MSNKTNLNLIGLSATLALSLAFTGCKDDLSEDSHYKTPSFLVGNAIEVLQKDGNYKTFLKGIELVGLNDVVDSQILTVLAPTDEAFSAFLKEKGYNSIEEMHKADPEYTKQMIAYHLLYYAMDWEKMTNFRPSEGDAATELDKAVQAGMYNRFRTRSVGTDELVKNTDASLSSDSVLTVVHNDRYVTVFSEKMFNTLGIDAASNYNYFFPNTTWNPNHLKNGFNVMNAAVLDTVAVVTDNGYLYHIDHVLEPVGTIYEELTQQGNYNLIRLLFDQYAFWRKYDIESSNRGYDVYLQMFSGLPNIANEWPSESYQNFAANSFNSWNLFVPTDQAMNRMFTSFWDENCGYKDIMSLNPLIQRILLLESVSYIAFDGSRSTSYMCFPDFIRQNKAISYFDTEITTDPMTFDANIICNNGVIYGSNDLEVPGVFSSVSGPVFKDVRYLPYLYALQGAGMLLSLASKESDFVTLIPDTAQFSHQEPKMRLFRDETVVPASYELQQWDDQSNGFVNVNSSYLEKMVNMNTSAAISDLNFGGVRVVETNEAFNYWYIKDGKISSNAVFNQLLNPKFKGDVWSNLREIPRSTTQSSWSNGHAYAYDYNSIYMPASGTTLEQELSQNNDRDYPYYCFVQLLKKASLVNKDGFVTAGATTIRFFDPESRFFAFIPTNEAIKNSLKDIPGCSSMSINESSYVIDGNPSNKNALINYLLSHFVTADRVSFNAYPYVGSSCKGAFTTAGSYLLNIQDDGAKLSVSFSAVQEGGTTPEGNVVNVVSQYDYFPFVFSDGAFQLIDEILK